MFSGKHLKKNNSLLELRQRLFFLLLGIFVYRLGSHIPIPGIDPMCLSELFDQQKNSIIGLFNVFSGGALQRLTIFALGIMPYISSSIILQLFTAVIPSLEQLKKEGASGKHKLGQYTKYGTLVLAVFQSFAFAKWLVSSNVVLSGNNFYITTIITLTAGTMFLVWLGEQMTERGIGNGISMLIFVGIISRFPISVAHLVGQIRDGQTHPAIILLIIALVIIVTSIVVFFENSHRKISINYAKRQVGRVTYNAQTSSLPLKINMSGVMPAIFASSIILFPATLAQWFGQSKNIVLLSKIGTALQIGQPLYLICYSAAIIFFCYFYTALMFNPKDISDNLKKSGAYISGIRPGDNTTNYIDFVITRITFIGAIYITFISLLPDILMFFLHMPFYFGGTSLLIVVVVLMEFISQIQSYIMSYQYDSIMKKQKLI